ncbi:MAG: LptF/LptG family permease [Thermodesulfobacteriota bacterium]
MPILLASYLAAEILAFLVASLAIVNGVLLLGKLVPFLDTLLDLGIGAADLVRIAAYLTAAVSRFTMPLATMAGVLLAFGRLGHDREIMGLFAAGIGVRRLLPPVAAVAAACAFITGLFTVELVPASQEAMRGLLLSLAKEKIDRGLKPQRFSDSLGQVVLYVDRIDRQAGRLEGVFVSDGRHRPQPVIITARSGSLAANPAAMTVLLELVDGSMHRSDGEVSETVRFATYQVVIPMAAPRYVAGRDALAMDRRSADLAELAAAVRQQDPGSAKAIELRQELHQRLALPVGCLILSLLAMPLAIQTGHAGRGLGMTVGLLLFVGYYVLMTAGGILAEGRWLGPGLAVWLPNLAYGLLAAGWLWRLERCGLLVGEDLASRLRRLLGRGREEQR